MSDPTIVSKFWDLYSVIPKVDRVKNLDTEEVKLYRLKSGLPVGIASTKDHLNYLPLITEYYDFFNQIKLFWVIPCDFPNERSCVSGFVLRGVFEKSYRTVKNPDDPQLVYGFHNFQNFKLDDPIILTEGVKDALFISQYYPYVLSLLTTNLTDITLDIISKLTSTVIIAFDSDFEGFKASKRVVNKLHDHGINSAPLVPSLKDWGQCIGSDYHQKLGESQILTALSVFKI